MTRKRTPNQLMTMCADLTRWNLGALIALSMAFGAGLFGVYKKVNEVDGKLNYLLLMIMGPGVRHEAGPSARNGAETLTVTTLAPATVDSLAARVGRGETWLAGGADEGLTPDQGEDDDARSF